ncbi:unnamed protein product [Anisakis simplex]|uniref:CNH domain-containing protein n=1 Tax=Anisakis simplex TaxID=6269 RepID=A0A0M3KH61_ANISI|nr:unnamed protein product [Anisakis simplex]
MHVSDLKAGFKCDRPTVRPTVIANLDTCHLITVHTDQRKLIRYLCVADPDQIHILHYSSRLGIFTPFELISTVEPATCLISMNDGIVFGADQFYYVDMETITSRPIVVAGCPSDFPLAAVAISDRELLLAYHNFGVFTDISGNRTRPENVDWNRAPLEFG